MTKEPESKLLSEKELLEKLYIEDKLSTRQIGERMNRSKEYIRNKLKNYGIPLRSYSEAMQVRMHDEIKYPIDEDISELELLLSELKDKVPPVKYKFKFRKESIVSVPLEFFDNPSKNKDAIITISMSDLHLGDADHLPDTYWSTINTLVNTLKVLKSKFNILRVNLVLNGDIVSGRGVYRYQEFRNILHRGHWQVFVAEMVINDTIDKINKIVKVNNIYLTKGTHEALAENYILYLKKILSGARYLGHYGVLDIAEPISHYNILFTHGVGKSDYYPVSYEMIRDIWKSVSQQKLSGLIIERFCVGHSHWLAVNIPVLGTTLDVSGGFQKWEFTINQRPAGMVLYLYTGDQCIAMPIRPNPKVENDERNDPMLEYKNIRYYSDTLIKHFKTIEMKTNENKKGN